MDSIVPSPETDPARPAQPLALSEGQDAGKPEGPPDAGTRREGYGSISLGHPPACGRCRKPHRGRHCGKAGCGGWATKTSEFCYGCSRKSGRPPSATAPAAQPSATSAAAKAAGNPWKLDTPEAVQAALREVVLRVASGAWTERRGQTVLAGLGRLAEAFEGATGATAGLPAGARLPTAAEERWIEATGTPPPGTAAMVVLVGPEADPKDLRALAAVEGRVGEPAAVEGRVGEPAAAVVTSADAPWPPSPGQTHPAPQAPPLPSHGSSLVRLDHTDQRLGARAVNAAGEVVVLEERVTDGWRCRLYETGLAAGTLAEGELFMPPKAESPVSDPNTGEPA